MAVNAECRAVPSRRPQPPGFRATYPRTSPAAGLQRLSWPALRGEQMESRPAGAWLLSCLKLLEGAEPVARPYRRMYRDGNSVGDVP